MTVRAVHLSFGFSLVRGKGGRKRDWVDPKKGRESVSFPLFSGTNVLYSTVVFPNWINRRKWQKKICSRFSKYQDGNLKMWQN
jgi:hypothetical protein